jgi:hypothetical protein
LTPSSNEDADRPEPLYCANDNVPVPADNPKCLHPSSYCPFRDLCEVVEAARKKRREEARHAQDEQDA